MSDRDGELSLGDNSLFFPTTATTDIEIVVADTLKAGLGAGAVSARPLRHGRAWAVMRKLTGRRRLLLPLALTILASAMLLWPELAVWYVSPGHPDSMCEPGGRPVGWPSWLPL